MKTVNLKKGTKLQPLTLPAISRTTLALFAGASNDHNPIHIDSDFARESGMDDVFAHGMLGMAYLSRLLLNVVPQTKIRAFEVKFSSVTQVGAILTCGGYVKEIKQIDAEECAILELTVSDQNQDVKLMGTSTIAIT